MKIIAINNITKRYGKTLAVDNVSVGIKSNSITAFIGPNGSGKSTLLKLLLGIIDQDEGNISISGDLRTGFLNDEYIPYEHLTLKDNFKTFSKLKGIKKKEVNNEVNRVLQVTFLENYSNKLYKDLSSGMKKKFHFGLALLGKPDILLLDEPFNSLDLVGRKDFVAILRYLREKRNITIILSSHDLISISDFCDDIIFLKNGKIILETDKNESIEFLNSKYLEFYKDDINKAIDLL